MKSAHHLSLSLPGMKTVGIVAKGYAALLQSYA